MQQNPTVADRVVNGIWLPPQRKEENDLVGGGEIFCCNGRNFVKSSLPQEACEFRTISMYHYASMIWIAQYDATVKSFLDEKARTSDDEDITSSEDSEPVYGWAELSFIWTEGSVSFATSAGDHNRLCKQRGDQNWAIALLPDRYYAEQDDWTDNLELGGFTGELSVLLGLIAFSVPTENLNDFLENYAYNNCEWFRDVLPGRHGRKILCCLRVYLVHAD